MDTTNPANQDQTRLWNGPAGQAWVEAQSLLDQMFAPFEAMLVDAVAATGPAAHVLDVGCGTGSTTLAMARQLGPEARCVGVDISGPMVALAQDRARQTASPARFIRADAQVHAFEAGHFDMIVSRFGVMFFEDPVQAFANLRRAARPGAQMALLAWRSADENPFMTTAERAAAPLLPGLPPRQPGAPGQFAFADRQRVAALLAESGWGDTVIDPIDVVCTLPEKQLLRYLTLLGPVGLALQHVDEGTREQVLGTVRRAFAPYVQGPDVRYAAACWMIRARAC